MDKGTGIWELQQPKLKTGVEAPEENSYMLTVGLSGVKNSKDAQKIAKAVAKAVRKQSDKGRVRAFAMSFSHFKGFIFR